MKQWPGTAGSQIFALGVHMKAVRNILMKYQSPLMYINDCTR